MLHVRFVQQSMVTVIGSQNTLATHRPTQKTYPDNHFQPLGPPWAERWKQCRRGTKPTLKLSRPSLPTVAFWGTSHNRGHYFGLHPVRPCSRRRLSTHRRSPQPLMFPKRSARYVTRRWLSRNPCSVHSDTALRNTAISHTQYTYTYTYTHKLSVFPVEFRPLSTLSGFTAPFLYYIVPRSCVRILTWHHTGCW